MRPSVLTTENCKLCSYSCLLHWLIIMRLYPRMCGLCIFLWIGLIGLIYLCYQRESEYVWGNMAELFQEFKDIHTRAYADTRINSSLLRTDTTLITITKSITHDSKQEDSIPEVHPFVQDHLDFYLIFPFLMNSLLLTAKMCMSV